ncbi:MAG: hypothetical protein Q9191_002849 [Dirinaria sp. TL-2023a]
MLGVDSETSAQGVLSQRAHEVAGADLPAAVEKPLPESPQQSPPVTPEALTHADSNDDIQPSSQTSVTDLNNEELESSQKASKTPDDHVQGSEPPASGNQASSERHKEITEKYSSLWTDKEEQIITKPFDYVKALPGKHFRAQILLAFNVWLQVDKESLGVIDKAIEMLHNASLLIDDIQDSSDLRRGSPAAHRIFGTAQSINAANYMCFMAQQELLKLQKPEVLQIYLEEILNAHRGQGIELFWRDTLTVPTEEEYLLMVSNKTGGLFRLAARLMQAVSPTTYNILPVAELVGLMFQVRDDHRSLSCEKMSSAKGFCEDLTEGKFSFPIIHSIRTSTSSNNEVLNILKLRTTNSDLKAHAVQHMHAETKSFEYTNNRLGDFHKAARDLLTGFELRNEQLGALVKMLSLA